jgi:hypothetical protein
MPGKLIGIFFGIFFALAGPAAIFYAGNWWALDRPAYHIGWCPFCLGWNAGADVQLAAIQKAGKAAQAHTQAVETRQAQVTTQAAQNDAQTQTRIITQTRTIEKLVPEYIDAQAVADCTVTRGTIGLLNAAAGGGELPPISDPAAKPDDSPSGVGIDTVAASVIGNYGSAEQNAAQLRDLEAWITAEQAVAK